MGKLRYKYGFISVICIIFMLQSIKIFAQTGENEFPPSFYYSQSLRSQKLTEVPVNFYIEDLRETDNWKAREGIPMPVSKLIEVNYSLRNSGEWITLPNNEHIWQLRLKAERAVAIMLYYSDFYIPTGGKLFIYSPDKSQLLGAYTDKTNPQSGLYVTDFIGGQELILEYVASTSSNEEPRIVISDVAYGYNTSALKFFLGIDLRASGSCEVNVNCEEGEAWRNEKQGICYMVQRIGTAGYICSGTLMNNTAEDFKPLILTARHCSSDGSRYATERDMEQWQFHFHMERTGCSNISPVVTPKIMVGCTLVARTEMSKGSDGLLLLLKNMIPEDANVYYNGWDRRNVVPNSGVCLHHPEGDQMKISTYNRPATITTFEASEFIGDKNAHLNVVFAATANGHGITEAGSSGSPLFNENKLVVGTLTGGSSTCLNKTGLNLYGRLYFHWDKYNVDSLSQMSVWLDPLNKGVESFAGRYQKTLRLPPVSLRAVNQGQGIYLSWNVPEGNVMPVRYNIYRNNQKIAETTGLNYIDNDALNGQNTYSVSAVYSGEEESSFVTVSIAFIKYKAPTDLQAARTSDSRVKVSWKAPVYEQTIYWGSIARRIGLDFYGEKVYFGQKWQSNELSPLNLNLIKAVQFYPVAGNSYQVYIKQGDRQYRQDMNGSTFKNNELNTVNLDEPFVIDASKDLIISIYVSLVGTDYPAVCDDGPAVNDKGNIYSKDGITWQSLSDDFNYNFVVTAVVSSEKGDILPQQLSAVRNEKISSQKNALTPRSIPQTQSLPTISLRSSAPIIFPQIAKYRIYRMGSPYISVDGKETFYIESTSSNHYTYEVSAFYSDVESPRSNSVGITPMSIESVYDSVDIFPSAFSNSVHFKGFEYSTHIDVVSVAGKICMRLNNPDQTIDVSALSPGMYFFRIYGDNNKVIKVVRTIKVN